MRGPKRRASAVFDYPFTQTPCLSWCTIPHQLVQVHRHPVDVFVGAGDLIVHAAKRETLMSCAVRAQAVMMCASQHEET